MHAPTAEALLRTWERGLDLSPTQRALAMLAAALPDAEPGQLAALPVGARDAVLLRLRAALFGDTVAALAPCPACQAPLDVGFRVGDVCVAQTADGAGTHRLCDGGLEIAYRVPSSADVLAVAGLGDAPNALLERCIVGARLDGAPVSAGALPERAVAALADAIAEADPQAHTELALHCPACGHAWNALFDIAAFLWIEIHALARHTLRDVHTLACAYGWPEADILAMSAARRGHYLALVRS